MFGYRIPFAALLSAAAFAFAASRSVSEGVYSKDQAARGKKLYEEQCSRCHGDTLGGGDGYPALAGADFQDKWAEKNLGDLFDHVHKSMPMDDPGHLSAPQISDLIAYILSENKFPAGSQPLPNDSASLIEIKLQKN